MKSKDDFKVTLSLSVPDSCKSWLRDEAARTGKSISYIAAEAFLSAKGSNSVSLSSSSFLSRYRLEIDQLKAAEAEANEAARQTARQLSEISASLAEAESSLEGSFQLFLEQLLEGQSLGDELDLAQKEAIVRFLFAQRLCAFPTKLSMKTHKYIDNTSLPTRLSGMADAVYSWICLQDGRREAAFDDAAEALASALKINSEAYSFLLESFDGNETELADAFCRSDNMHDAEFQSESVQTAGLKLSGGDLFTGFCGVMGECLGSSNASTPGWKQWADDYRNFMVEEIANFRYVNDFN